jgi:beta-lactamase class A
MLDTDILSTHERHKSEALVFIIITLLLVAGFFVWYIYNAHEKKIDTTAKVNDTHNSEISTVTGTAAPIVQKPSVSTSLESTWSSLVSSRQGAIDVAVYDPTNDQIAHYTNVDTTFSTASIVKLSILEEVLLQDQTQGQSITASQMAIAAPMIENSDNDSATALWIQVGGSKAMDSFFSQIGASSTTAAGQGAWGLTKTTALDQLKVVNAIAYPGVFLSGSSATVASNLLDQVESDQTWGVSGGVPTGVTIELKNGWLPDSETNGSYSNTSDWVVNSIGHIYGAGVDYTIAVLTDGNPSEKYGIQTIESLSAATWNDLSAAQSQSN